MEPIFTSPELQRYTRRPFPPYRYLPFQAGSPLPHPRTDPAGHSYNEEDDFLPGFAPEDWSGCELFLYGIDLFNHGYWWEAHEAFETIWHAAGQRSTQCGRFVQGLIQLSGSFLKRFTGEMGGAESLHKAAITKLSAVNGVYLGINVPELISEAQRCLHENAGVFPRISLSNSENGTKR